MWLNSLRPQSIETWAEMQAEFFKKFFPTHRTTTLKKQIQTCSSKENEPFGVCWERCKDLLNLIPHHGYNDHQIVGFFYEGISSQNRQFLERMCNGEFLNKETSDALEYFDFLAENSQSWDYSNPAERTTHVVSFDQLNAGKIVFREQEDLSQKFAHLTRKLEKLELTQAKEVAVVAKVDEMCHICDTLGHSTNECPTIPAFKEVLHGTIEQVDVNALNQAQNQARQPVNFPLSATYTPEWCKHSNFSWRNADNPGPSQGPLGNFQNQSQFPNPPQQNFQPLGGQGPPRFQPIQQ